MMQEPRAKLHIGLLVGRFPPDRIGGAELQAQQVAKELARCGHEVVVFTRRYSGRPYRQRQDGYLIRRRDEVPIPGLRVFWDNVPALWQIARQRPRLQVLLCYQTLNSGLIGTLAQTWLGIPAVVSIRGNKEYRIAQSTINRMLVPRVYGSARYLIVQSPRILEDLSAQLALAGRTSLWDRLQSKVRIIPNGIDVEQGLLSRGSKILYVGRLIEDKGVADLIEAVRHLAAAEVVIVGDGPDRERLQALAKGLPVVFAGQVLPSAVTDYLHQGRVLVLPSYLGDGFPNVILEAMACGVPVVATRTAGIPTLVRDEETGFLFEPGDVETMAGYIDRLQRDDALWTRMAARSLEAVQAYSWDAVTPLIEELLLEAAYES
jgi:glycogen(starch) synthase